MSIRYQDAGVLDHNVGLLKPEVMNIWQLTWRVVLPLFIILFVGVTRHQTMTYSSNTWTESFYGFPWPYSCSGWHTSLSWQYFIWPMLADMAVYLVACFILIYTLNKLLNLRPSKILTIMLWVPAVLLLALFILKFSMPDNVYYMSTPYVLEAKESGWWLFGEEL